MTLITPSKSSSSGVHGSLRQVLCIDLLIDIFDLEVEIDGGVLDPLEALVEIFECLLHVGELLTSFVAFHEVQISCICMLLIGLLHLIIIIEI